MLMSKSLITALISLAISIYTCWLNCNHLETMESQIVCIAEHMKGN